MTNEQIHAIITENQEKIFSYALRHVSKIQDAEDLAQDIILTLLSSYQNIQNDESIYGFLWGIAQNKYAEWVRRKNRNEQFNFIDEISESEIPSYHLDESNPYIELLRRELALTAANYRGLLVGFYKDKKSCRELAEEFGMTESTVKYLLFKARTAIKEGLQMERVLGEQSYRPSSLNLHFYGKVNRYHDICRKKIVQNILMACYNDTCSLQEISLQIGCAVPYIEDEMDNLLKNGLIKKNQYGKYYTDVVIFTSQFKEEILQTEATVFGEIGKDIYHYISKHLKELRSLGFVNAEMNDNALTWLMSLIVLNHAAKALLKEKTDTAEDDLVWCVEDEKANEFDVALCKIASLDNSYIQFLDVNFEENEYPPHRWLFGNHAGINLLFAMARQEKNDWSETEKIVLDGIDCFFHQEGGRYIPSMPIFTWIQFDSLISLLQPIIQSTIDHLKKLQKQIAWALENHTPRKLLCYVPRLAPMYLLGEAFRGPISYMWKNELLKRPIGDIMTTAYMVLTE